MSLVIFQYWGLDANEVEPCCWMTYTQHRDTQEVLTTLDKLDIDFDENCLKDPEEVYRRYTSIYISIADTTLFETSLYFES